MAHHEVLGDLLHVLEVEEGVEAQLVCKDTPVSCVSAKGGEACGPEREGKVGVISLKGQQGHGGPNGCGHRPEREWGSGGPVGKEGRPKQAGWGRDALTIEAHVMVGEDGRAVPFGGAPDHDVQQAVRCLNVMFLEGR